MSLLDVNNISNYVQVPVHISGHILDLVLTSVGVDLFNRVKVSPVDHRISDHAFITFELDVIGPTTYSEKITFRIYRGLNVREAAAFSTVDHQFLISDFSDCGVEGTALSLLESYLENRDHCVAIGESRSEPVTLQYGVPQDSVLSPVLFTVYTGTLAFLLEDHGVSYHFFADDTRLYIRVEDIDEAKHRLSSLLSDLKIWMARKSLN